MATVSDLINQLGQFIPGKLSDDDPLTESNWNKLVDLVKKFKDIIEQLNTVSPPVGFVYIQLPGTPTPDVLWNHPSSKWKNISPLFPGVFFRVSGGNAATFNANVPLTGTAPPAQLTYNEGDGGAGGGQEDGAPNIKGNFKLNTSGADGANKRWDVSGAFSEYSPRYYQEGVMGWRDGHGSSPEGLAFDASASNAKYKNIAEVRPKNITVQIWQRIS